jgi:pimeloyl-ACP methyl ester carboxylesterase
VIRPDLRGYGASTGPDGIRTLDVFAGDLVGLLDHLQLPAAIVCGLSMGGQIALELFRLFPQRVAGLILADTSARADTALGALARYRYADLVLAEGMEGYAAELLPKMISPRTIATRPEVAAHVLAMMRGTSPAGAAAALRGRAQRPDYGGLLAEIGVPTLLVVGDEDQFTPVADAESMYDRLPDPRLVVIHGAGHLPNLEQPSDFNDAVAGFLASCSFPQSADSALELGRTETKP